jgi:hypothetical protein
MVMRIPLLTIKKATTLNVVVPTQQQLRKNRKKPIRIPNAKNQEDLLPDFIFHLPKERSID